MDPDVANPEPGELVDESSLVVEIAALRPTLVKAFRLFAETIIIPSILFIVLIQTNGLLIALAASLGWCYLALGTRWLRGRHLPGTMFLCIGMMSARGLIALATSSAFLYLLQPALGSLCMALLFLGSALLGKPVTMRLARDFVMIPAHILSRRGVRRMFTQIALLWGVSRLADAGMSLGFLRYGLDAGLLSRGLFSPLLTVFTILVCIGWGVRSLRRDGIHLRLGAVPAI